MNRFNQCKLYLKDHLFINKCDLELNYTQYKTKIYGRGDLIDLSHLIDWDINLLIIYIDNIIQYQIKGAFIKTFIKNNVIEFEFVSFDKLNKINQF